MDIKQTTKAIIQVRKNREQAGHIWLQGFHEIINCSILGYEKINYYLREKLSEYTPFTKYNSSSQMFKLIQALLDDSQHPISLEDIDISNNA
jgi:hypothetical protein